MNRSKVVLLLVFALVLGAFESCANRVAPSGGAKDTAPPKTVGMYPINESTNFNKQEVVIKFDEYIQLENPNQEILISPLMKKSPEYKLKGKSLIIKFQEELADSTTYTIRFGQSIKDLTEGNKLPAFEYSFSTGPILDSLYLKGKVVWAETKKPAENVLISLYPPEPDTLFASQAPKYISRTDEFGNFKITRLAYDRYRAYALSDMNNNFFFDQSNEAIAFNDSIYGVDGSQEPVVELFMFQEGFDEARLLQKNHKSFGRVELIYSQPQADLNVSFPDSSWLSNPPEVTASLKNDTINIWYTDSLNKSMNIVVNRFGFDNDSILIKRLLDTSFKAKLRYGTNIQGGRETAKIHPRKPVYLKLNNPILSIDFQGITLYEGEEKLNISSVFKQDSIDNKKLLFNYNWKAETQYKIEIKDSSLVDYFGQYNELIEKSFSTAGKESYGTLIIKALRYNSEKTYGLRLLDKDDKPVKAFALTDSLTTIDYLKSGKYNLYIYEDENQNLRWDTGNFSLKKQAEKSYSSKRDFDLKGNWETEIEIDLGKY